VGKEKQVIMGWILLLKEVKYKWGGKRNSFLERGEINFNWKQEILA